MRGIPTHLSRPSFLALLTLLALLALASAARPARAADADAAPRDDEVEASSRMTPEARARYDRGLALYQGKDYAGAIKAFEEGFALEPRREFLFAGAQARRLAGDCRGAVPLYQRFLEMTPPPVQASATHIALARCAQQMAAEKPAPAPPPAAPAPAPPPPPWTHDRGGAALLGAGVVGLAVGVAFLAASFAALPDADARTHADYARGARDRRDAPRDRRLRLRGRRRARRGRRRALRVGAPRAPRVRAAHAHPGRPRARGLVLSAARARLLAALVALAAPTLTTTMSCLPQGDFRCHDHAACGGGASCEVDGRCSAADVRCPSGRRYLAHEGDASSTCVGDSCAGDPLVEVAAGADHACARRRDGSVSCWGRNDDGQLGDGTRTPRALDVAVKDLAGAVSVAAGQRHTCAATSKGEVLCWGADDAGQLGDGGGPSRARPLAVAGISTALAVSAGEAFSCAVLTDGTVQCWGDNSLGQLGDGGDAKPDRLPTTVFALTGVRALSGKWQHVCALRDDETLWCWGANSAGQLGDGSSWSKDEPAARAGAKRSGR